MICDGSGTGSSSELVWSMLTLASEEERWCGLQGGGARRGGSGAGEPAPQPPRAHIARISADARYRLCSGWLTKYWWLDVLLRGRPLNTWGSEYHKEARTIMRYDVHVIVIERAIFIQKKATTPCNLNACLGYCITMLNLPRFNQIIPVFKNYILKISVYLSQKKIQVYLTLKPDNILTNF